MGEQGFGQSIRRSEDARFLIGAGRYTADIDLAGQARACFLRSPHAHADIATIDTGAARAAPGVIAVLTGDDAAADGLLAEAEGQGQEIRVVEPYLIEVALEGAGPRPVSYLEAIRAKGPTVRLDLGKQADFA